jgi:seryl-tRNA synthetase
MLDVKFIREHQDELQRVAHAKGIEVSIHELVALDDERLNLLKQVEALRHQRNDFSKQIAALVHEGRTAEAEQTKQAVRDINADLTELESRYTEVQRQFDALMLLVPNIVSPDTPDGESDADNVELKRVGEPPTFDFAPRDHVLLAESLDMLDIPRGVKIAGTRGYVLKNAGVYLHRAVQQLALDLLRERGFTVLDVPLMVREETLVGTGFFPLGRDQTYAIPKDERWLVGTAEVPLVAYYSDEIVDVREPIRLAAVSNCFRREAGSAGRDVRGLYRVHQFAKVEQVILCKNDVEESERMFAEITKNAEDLLQMLELPYRVVAVCTGDLSQKNYKQYDIETWMPSRESYGETHSSSILLDFQARRANIRYRDENGKLQFCHTLNNTAVATPRILIPLLENHQRADGSIYIPKALRKYMDGIEELKPARL